MADEYASGEYRYWHLSVPSPELTQAIEDGWFPTRGRVLDLGCGAGTGSASSLGSAPRPWGSICRSMPSRSRQLSTGPGGSCRPTPRSFRSPQDPSKRPSTAAACITSRATPERATPPRSGASFVRVAGFLLRACLRAAGIRNDLDESVLRSVFVGWRVRSIVSHEIPTDGRMMQAIVARLEHA